MESYRVHKSLEHPFESGPSTVLKIRFSIILSSTFRRTVYSPTLVINFIICNMRSPCPAQIKNEKTGRARVIQGNYNCIESFYLRIQADMGE